MKITWILLAALLMLPTGAASAEAITLLPVEQFGSWYYANPSTVSDIGDPFILNAEGAYWCFATSSGAGFKAWRSEDLLNWEPQKGLAYKMSPASWGRGNFWAPEVYFYEGMYRLFYSAKKKGSDGMALGLATAEKPGGPYKDAADQPLFDPGYSVIDASLFVDDDGQPYLYYARDCSDNVVNGSHQSHVYGVKLKKDLSGDDGEPVLLTRPDQPWEQAGGTEWMWNEGPVMRKENGAYWLFYSANYFEAREYDVGAARSDGPLGPFTKLDANPLLKYQESDGVVIISGPGHNSFLTLPDGEQFMVYHTHTNPFAPSGDRQMALDRFGYHADGTPYVNGPTLSPQLRPMSLSGLESLLPGATVTGGAAEALGFLTDGDYGISQASQAYTWRSADKADAWAEFQLPKPRDVEAVLIYAPKGTSGTGRVIFDGGGSIDFDLGQTEDAPGACLRLHFAPRQTQSIRIELDQPPALCEVIALARLAPQ